MVRTAIRPDDYVEFRDPSTKAVVFSTADSSRVYLSELDEGTAEVKSITVDVPAADGALDLTESVAGRPLYGNRTVTMTVSLVCADHPAAVAAVQSARRAIHGRMLEVETPDTRVSEGWYVGRVSIDNVDYPGEAAVLHITANCRPWVFYGTETVALTSGTPTTYADNDLAIADRARYSEMLIEVGQPTGKVWDQSTNYAYAGHVPNRIALVASANANLMLYGTMGRWQTWSKTHSAGDTFDMGWSRDDSIVDTVNRTGQIIYANANHHKATRALITTLTDSGTELGMMVTDMTDRITVYVQAAVLSTGYTTEDVAAGVRFFVQGSHRPDTPDDASGGTLANGEPIAYTAITPDQYGLIDTSLTIDPSSVIPNQAGDAAGYIVFGIEATWCTIEALNVRVKMHRAGADVSVAMPNSTVAYLELPERLYSNATTRNIARITPYGNTFEANLAVADGSTTATVIPTEATQLPAVELSGSVAYLRAYGITERGWKPLQVNISLYPWSNATFDAGDMPTALEANLGAPTAFTANGERFIIAASGTLPFTLAGEVELPYMAMGADGTLTFERGTV